jgi:uncharacterized protein (DUF1330 family)
MMAKSYWISRCEVHDPEAYKRYIEIAVPAFVRHGAKFLARGGKVEAMMGAAMSRNIVIEFPSMEAARAFFNSPEYTEALNWRRKSSTGEIYVVEGCDPQTQP